MTFEKVQELLSKQLGIKKDNITLTSKVQEDLNADSLDVVEMLMTLEDEFEIEVEETEALKLKTVNDIVKLIDEHTKA